MRASNQQSDRDLGALAPTFRIGLGTDLHRLAAGRTLRIGGVEVPSQKGAVGHSDADVVLHAVADAMLGAIAAGDIGELFPDTDAAHADLDSAVIVEAARKRVLDAGYVVSNVDVVVDLERPKLLPFRESIRRRLAELLGVAVDRVGFKAKTAERLGPIGAGEAIGCQAVVCIVRESQ